MVDTGYSLYKNIFKNNLSAIFHIFKEFHLQLKIHGNPYYPPDISFENHETCAISKEHFSVT